MVSPVAGGKTASRSWVPAAAAICGLLLSLNCGHSRTSRDASADQGDPNLPSGAEPDDFLDGATPLVADAGVSDPERDGGTSEDADQDGPARALATCRSYELVGPARPVTKPAVPSVRVGSRYAVLATPSTKPVYYTDAFFYDVVFSWFDPETASFTESVTAFRFEGYANGGIPVDFGTAMPAAIISVPNGFAVLWTAYRQSKHALYMALLDRAGAAISQAIVLENDLEQVGDIVWGGSQFAVSWVAWSSALRLGRIDAQGNLVGTTEVTPNAYLGPVRLFWDGAAYGVFWESLMPAFDEIWFARVDREGAIMLAPRQLMSPDHYGGNLLVGRIDDGYLAYWREITKTTPWSVQAVLHKLDQNGQDLSPVRLLDEQACRISALAVSGAEIGVLCFDHDAIGLAGLGPYESTELTPVLSIGLPKPNRDGVSPAWASAFYGKDDGFDVFWSGTLDGATWGTYLSQIRCAE